MLVALVNVVVTLVVNIIAALILGVVIINPEWSIDPQAVYSVIEGVVILGVGVLFLGLAYGVGLAVLSYLDKKEETQEWVPAPTPLPTPLAQQEFVLTETVPALLDELAKTQRVEIPETIRVEIPETIRVETPVIITQIVDCHQYEVWRQREERRQMFALRKIVREVQQGLRTIPAPLPA